MGIKGLFPFLREKAPAAIKERSLKDYLGRTRAIDARDGANVASIARVEGANAWDRCARDFLKIHGTLARGETSRWVETRARALEGSNSMRVTE